MIEIAGASGRFIGGAVLAGIGESAACPVEPAIARPWLAEDSDAARREDALNLPSRLAQVEMVQDRVAPDAFEAGVRAGQAFGIANEQADGHAVGVRTGAGFTHIAGRQIAGGDDGAAPGKHDRRHAMAAAQIEDVQTAHVAERIERRRDPRFVLQVAPAFIGKADNQVRRLHTPERIDRSLGLPVVESPFAVQTVNG